MSNEKLSIADLVAHQQAKLGLTNAQIAKQVGFKTQNILSMIKRREMNIPLRKVTSIAKALEIDPVQFAIQWSEECDAGLTELLTSISEQPPLSAENIKLAEVVKKITGGLEIDMFNKENEEELEKIKQAVNIMTQRKLDHTKEMLKVNSMMSIKERKEAGTS